MGLKKFHLIALVLIITAVCLSLSKHLSKFLLSSELFSLGPFLRTDLQHIPCSRGVRLVPISATRMLHF